MTEESFYEEYDDTPLMGEELVEKYYLDKRRLLGIKTNNEDYWHDTGIENVMPDDFLYYTKQDLLDTQDFEWSITYQFSSDYRNPFYGGGQYGNTEMTFRRLYIILCECFLGGVYFIQVYFEQCYPYRVKEYVEGLLSEAKDAFLELAEEAELMTRRTKEGKLDRRYKVNNLLKELGEESFNDVAEEAEKIIKEDIITCLETGIIPLNYSLKPSTLARREELGISSIEPFYATGQLIYDLKLFFRLEKKQWQTKSGTMV